MSKKIITIFCISVISFIIFLSYYSINSNRPPSIPTNIDKIKILDCRVGKEITINDSKEINNLIKKVNTSEYRKEHINDFPNGPTYRITFIKGKRHYVMSIFYSDDYCMINFQTILKNYKGIINMNHDNLLIDIKRLFEIK